MVTATLNFPPASPIVSFVRDKEKTHGAGCWLTATLCAPTTIAADRGDGAGFAATVYGTVPSPCPLAPPSATHEALLVTDHVQSRAVEIAKDPLPPGEGNEFGLVVIVRVHRSAASDGAVIDVAVFVHAEAIVAQTAASAAARVFR